VICPKIRYEGRIRRDRVDKDEVDLHVRIAIQTARIVDVEPVQDAIGKFVIAGPVIRILETLNAHAHDDVVGMPLLPNAKHVEIVQVGCLIFAQQRSDSTAAATRKAFARILPSK
jgi:DUF1680 family protein